ncbi:endonuclease/Exonuclease/phosphatase [Colletotrichum tamarilloi]|uniref:Endonuclease/Exonuclease/phosphatase n=1 Tax=Colletotrichum tamarilloi TaxID=1209934 RepID=A0ABQ9R2K6_9PEZI|nr:endonuclease/Exonuclease/phosphatase [Colletotrichum tamarilloi]KAI3544280.1 endonuclease/Exonuclease/phosphatase [Colletotrichum filicis]KAK1492972.1 endonuclease/Exonuclease/phosphatase [Colletotrichum tamarilloi]
MATLVDVNSTAPADKMAPSTLDLFMLTFNCAKNFIDTHVFASNLHTAFKQSATPLPEVVVFSLQEFAPLSYSFIGGYFLSPYLTRFEEALNLAATRYTNESPTSDADSHDGADDETILVKPTAPTPVRPYTLIRTRNIGMTAIMLFARNPESILRVQEAEVGFGAAEMGNKGAVALRVLYEGTTTEGGKKETELTFVATHLAAMEWNLPRRNANWATIMRGLTFENPEDILHPKKNKPTTPTHGEGQAEGARDEAVHLLHDEHQAQTLALQERLQEISVFKPSSHLFVGGDLNYRISTTSPPPMATFPSLDPDSEHHYSRFFALDQLTRERQAGRTLHGMSEAEVKFPPTYKYNVLPQDDTRLEVDGVEDVPWVFAPHRYPGWTDRILYLDVPSWVKTKPQKVDVKIYDAMPVVRSSDHRAVFLRAAVPLLTEKELVRSSTEAPTSNAVDPRLVLPVAIDPEAWERRAAARRKEVLVGWSMFLWSTKQGAMILATLLAVGAGIWWLS